MGDLGRFVKVWSDTVPPKFPYNGTILAFRVGLDGEADGKFANLVRM
jgi:hypothetical protein